MSFSLSYFRHAEAFLAAWICPSAIATFLTVALKEHCLKNTERWARATVIVTITIPFNILESANKSSNVTESVVKKDYVISTEARKKERSWTNVYAS